MRARRWQQARVPLATKLLEQLQTLDAGTWFSPGFAGTTIPTLLEALELITAQVESR